MRLQGTIARAKKPLKKPTQLLVNTEQKGHPYNYTLGKKSTNLHLPLHSQEACFLIMKNMNIIKLLILSMVFLIYFQSFALSYMYVLKNIKRLFLLAKLNDNYFLWLASLSNSGKPHKLNMWNTHCSNCIHKKIYFWNTLF